MKDYSEDAWERAMKVQEAILRATVKQIIRPGDRRDHRHLGSEYAALAGAARGVRVRWASGSAARQANP